MSRPPDLIANSSSWNGLALADNREFAADGVFCEWAYVIDFKANVFEVYEGFFKKDDEILGRFKDMQKPDEEYGPVSLVASWSLDDLPSEEEFLAKLEPQEEEDAA